MNSTLLICKTTILIFLFFSKVTVTSCSHAISGNEQNNVKYKADKKNVHDVNPVGKHKTFGSFVFNAADLH